MNNCLLGATSCPRLYISTTPYHTHLCLVCPVPNMDHITKRERDEEQHQQTAGAHLVFTGNVYGYTGTRELTVNTAAVCTSG